MSISLFYLSSVFCGYFVSWYVCRWIVHARWQTHHGPRKMIIIVVSLPHRNICDQMVCSRQAHRRTPLGSFDILCMFEDLCVAVLSHFTHLSVVLQWNFPYYSDTYHYTMFQWLTWHSIYLALQGMKIVIKFFFIIAYQ